MTPCNTNGTVLIHTPYSMDDNSLNLMVIKILTKVESQLGLGYTLPSEEFYQGTTTANKLGTNVKLRSNFRPNKPLAVICNTIHSSRAAYEMGHWVAIISHYIPQQKIITVRYFDSFAGGVNKYKFIKTYVNSIRDQCQKWNIRFKLDSMDKPLQYFKSAVCGIYAAYCIIKAYEGKNKSTLNKIFSTFTSNRIKNDLRVSKYLVDNYPAPFCHDNPIYNKMKATLKELKMHKIPPPFCPRKTLGLKTCLSKCKCQKCCATKKLYKRQ